LADTLGPGAGVIPQPPIIIATINIIPEGATRIFGCITASNRSI